MLSSSVMKPQLLSIGLAAVLLWTSFSTSSAARLPAARLSGLHLSGPAIADVGGSPSFSLRAHSWPAHATVTLRFLSPHHGFTGSMLWDVRCGCFRLGVFLARRVHPLERATAWATVRWTGGSVTTSMRFQVRGLAPGGKQYAPGGAPHLSAWLSDTVPIQGEQVHFCAWVHAADAIGISGTPVSFALHYKTGIQHLSAGKTNRYGMACAVHSIGSTQVKIAVPVDVYAGRIHSRIDFTPRR